VLAQEGAEFLVYEQVILGEDTKTLFLLTEEKGLIKGTYKVKLEIGKDCDEIIRKFRSAIAKRYPNIFSEDNRFNHASSLSFCDAVQIGKAGYSEVWNDPGSPAKAAVLLSPGEDEVQVVYEGPGFEEWSDSRKDTEVQEKF
jgi:hypothetical protein